MLYSVVLVSATHKVNQLYGYIFPLPLGATPLHPSRLSRSSQSTEPSPLCYTAASHCCCCCCCSVVSDSVRPHRRQPIRLPRPWDSPGKNTGVGCHFLLQCMKVKSESEVAQSCPTLSDPMDCSPPGSSVHGIFQARVLEWGAIVFHYNQLKSLQNHELWMTLVVTALTGHN